MAITLKQGDILTLKDFEEQISKEKKGQFDSETKVGFF